MAPWSYLGIASPLEGFVKAGSWALILWFALRSRQDLLRTSSLIRREAAWLGQQSSFPGSIEPGEQAEAILMSYAPLLAKVFSLGGLQDLDSLVTQYGKTLDVHARSARLWISNLVLLGLLGTLLGMTPTLVDLATVGDTEAVQRVRLVLQSFGTSFFAAALGVSSSLLLTHYAEADVTKPLGQLLSDVRKACLNTLVVNSEPTAVPDAALVALKEMTSAVKAVKSAAKTLTEEATLSISTMRKSTEQELEQNATQISALSENLQAASKSVRASAEECSSKTIELSTSLEKLSNLVSNHRMSEYINAQENILKTLEKLNTSSNSLNEMIEGNFSRLSHLDGEMKGAFEGTSSVVQAVQNASLGVLAQLQDHIGAIDSLLAEAGKRISADRAFFVQQSGKVEMQISGLFDRQFESELHVIARVADSIDRLEARISALNAGSSTMIDLTAVERQLQGIHAQLQQAAYSALRQAAEPTASPVSAGPEPELMTLMQAQNASFLRLESKLNRLVELQSQLLFKAQEPTTGQLLSDRVQGWVQSLKDRFQKAE